jgi:sRNA-binding protein
MSTKSKLLKLLADNPGMSTNALAVAAGVSPAAAYYHLRGVTGLRSGREQRALDACGHEDWRKCTYCKQWDDPANLYCWGERQGYHRACHTAYIREYNAKKREQKQEQTTMSGSVSWKEYIEYLAEAYPQCFFVDGKQRRPLKKGIIADILKREKLDGTMLIEAIENYYMSSWGYLHQLIAGHARLDLDGNEVERSTIQEREEAGRRLAESKKQQYGKKTVGKSWESLKEMYDNGEATDCDMSKLKADVKKLNALQPQVLRIAKEEKPQEAKMNVVPIKNSPLVAPELQRVHELLSAANATLLGVSDKSTRAVVGPMLLALVTTELNRVIEELK